MLFKPFQSSVLAYKIQTFRSFLELDFFHYRIGDGGGSSLTPGQTIRGKFNYFFRAVEA